MTGSVLRSMGTLGIRTRRFRGSGCRLLARFLHDWRAGRCLVLWVILVACLVAKSPEVGAPMATDDRVPELCSGLDEDVRLLNGKLDAFSPGSAGGGSAWWLERHFLPSVDLIVSLGPQAIPSLMCQSRKGSVLRRLGIVIALIELQEPRSIELLGHLLEECGLDEIDETPAGRQLVAGLVGSIVDDTRMHAMAVGSLLSPSGMVSFTSREFGAELVRWYGRNEYRIQERPGLPVQHWSRGGFFVTDPKSNLQKAEEGVESMVKRLW